MKKLLVLVSLGFIGTINAKDSEVKSNLKEKKITNEILYRYAYLYQSTCGWTFNMYTETPVGQMTADQYDDYIDELISKNDYVCKLYGDKPNEGYVVNQKDHIDEKRIKF